MWNGGVALTGADRRQFIPPSPSPFPATPYGIEFRDPPDLFLLIIVPAQPQACSILSSSKTSHRYIRFDEALSQFIAVCTTSSELVETILRLSSFSLSCRENPSRSRSHRAYAIRMLGSV